MIILLKKDFLFFVKLFKASLISSFRRIEITDLITIELIRIICTIRTHFQLTRHHITTIPTLTITPNLLKNIQISQINNTMEVLEI